MTIRALIVVSSLAFAFALAAGCSGKSKCDSTNCTGCCVDANTCADGTAKAQCGGDGEACQMCSGICFMHKCSGGNGGGDGGTDAGTDGGTDGGTFDAGLLLPCPQSCAGCCSNGLCFAGTDSATCGIGGLACSQCAASQSCTNNVCTDTNCAGCVSGATCRNPPNDSHCGVGGKACFDCGAAGSTCVTATGACTGGACATGCVDTQGRCQGGENKGYCGHGGAACVACGQGQGCSDGGCIAIGNGNLPGDFCSGAESLAFGTTVTGTTLGYSNDTSASCGGSGPDHFYLLSVPGSANAVVTVAPVNSSYRPVVYVRGSCDTMELGCGQANGAGSSAVISSVTLGAGTYYLIVDGADGTSGDYSIVTMSQ